MGRGPSRRATPAPSFHEVLGGGSPCPPCSGHVSASPGAQGWSLVGPQLPFPSPRRGPEARHPQTAAPLPAAAGPWGQALCQGEVQGP